MKTPDLILNNAKNYYSCLEIDSFVSMLKDPSFCYKFYWLEAIVNIVNQNIVETTMGDVIDEMIVNAWYSVVEYHIHLSGRNGQFTFGFKIGTFCCATHKKPCKSLFNAKSRRSFGSGQGDFSRTRGDA